MNRTTTFLWAAVMTLAVAGQARAYVECEVDADCVDGFRCEVMEVETCTDIAPCPEGEECPEPDPIPCETETFGMCVPAPCATDADCGEGLQCLAVTYDDCPAEDVADPCIDPECGMPAPPEEPECEEVVEYMCLPTFMAPCETAADCGAGFECVADEICECSGEVPADPEEPTPEPECTCEPTGASSCSPLEVECSADTDCVEGWTCELWPDTPVCDPEGSCEEEPGFVANGTCMPPYWDVYWYDAEDGDGGGVEAATGSDDFRVDDPITADSIDEGAAGCNATATAPGAGDALWLLPLLLIGLARKR